jgi:lipopolysaccharide/colanic/teichoic acid biosynthesis glycosyltransferase
MKVRETVPMQQLNRAPLADPGPAPTCSEHGSRTAVSQEERAGAWYILRHLYPRYGKSERIPLAWRMLECVIALCMLILTAPIMLALAVAVAMDSPGNPLFRQYRIGRGGKLFRFIKFRTLYADARQKFPHLYAYRYTAEEIEHLCFKVTNDPRVTRLGCWLRRSTLDELPNFWHVLTGDMALVGPRPEIPEMLPYYPEETLLKFSVRPGITGLAQISGRGRLRFLETARLDVEYVRRRSAALDVKIMLRTLYLILRQDGAF